MHQATVLLPVQSDLQSVLWFARDLEGYAAHDRLTIDFGEPRFFSPFMLLFWGAKLQQFTLSNPGLELTVKNHASHPYPGHMGFFRMFGIDHGRDVGEAWGSETYLPITCVTQESFYEQPGDRFQEFPDLVQRHADRIASMITRDRPEHKNLFDVLSYSVREVMRNVFEHSKADRLYYAAQYWPKSNRVEFAIADFGIGIRKGLAENPNFRFRTDKEAIEASLLPSVSGKTHLPRLSNTWFNSGYGLYMTNRLARNGGNFVLASGSTGIHMSRRTKANLATAFKGTALRFNFNVDEIGDVQSRLEEFRRDGYAIARAIAGSGNRPPSAMSLLLRRDYGSNQ